MRLTQGTFSYLPDFSDDEIRAQAVYVIDKGWAISVEYADDPHPRNVYWDMWGLPLFDDITPDDVMRHVNECRAAFPDHYIQMTAYDRTYLRQTTGLSFIVNRPKVEPGFQLTRQEVADRRIQYTLHSYATEAPVGSRYKNSKNGAQ
jgi:ribulose-bisphosphate carboxylase small chain